MLAYVHALKVFWDVRIMPLKNTGWYMPHRTNNPSTFFGSTIALHLPILVIISHRIIENYFTISLDILKSNEGANPDDGRIWITRVIQVDAVVAVWVNPYIPAEAHPIFVSF